MTLYVYIFQETPVRLWGLTMRERLRRELASAGCDATFVDDPGRVPQGGRVLLVRGDYLYDNRVINGLVQSPDTALLIEDNDGSVIVAANVSATLAAQLPELIGGSGRELPRELKSGSPDTLSSTFQRRLRKAYPPFVLLVTAQDCRALEHHLFNTAYKGITDLVTKWVWPVPARWATRLCARYGIRPNHVTSVSWLLAIVTGFLFVYGHFVTGLLTGWVMTFLDTVDGKLARVTVTSTKWGNLFDHLLDLLHPPFWYLAWGTGLEAYHPVILPDDLSLTVALIFAGYIAGRLVEGAFKRWVGGFDIFIWRPVDSFSRLVTARRNPCLILMTLSLLWSRPDLGLEAVALWTLISTAFLLLRLFAAIYCRLNALPPSPWLAEANVNAGRASLAVRWFTQSPALPTTDGRA